MDSFLRPPLDFTVSREDWSRYDLSDNSILKIKLIATENSKEKCQLQYRCPKYNSGVIKRERSTRF